jgi:hypothetical protein
VRLAGRVRLPVDEDMNQMLIGTDTNAYVPCCALNSGGVRRISQWHVTHES